MNLRRAHAEQRTVKPVTVAIYAEFVYEPLIPSVISISHIPSRLVAENKPAEALEGFKMIVKFLDISFRLSLGVNGISAHSPFEIAELYENFRVLVSHAVFVAISLRKF